MARHKILTGLTCVFFFGWLLSGWMYLKGHAPFGYWDETRISAIPDGNAGRQLARFAGLIVSSAVADIDCYEDGDFDQPAQDWRSSYDCLNWISENFDMTCGVCCSWQHNSPNCFQACASEVRDFAKTDCGSFDGFHFPTIFQRQLTAGWTLNNEDGVEIDEIYGPRPECCEDKPDGHCCNIYGEGGTDYLWPDWTVGDVLDWCLEEYDGDVASMRACIADEIDELQNAEPLEEFCNEGFGDLVFPLPPGAPGLAACLKQVDHAYASCHVCCNGNSSCYRQQCRASTFEKMADICEDSAWLPPPSNPWERD